MPHVTIHDAVPLRDYHEAFRPSKTRREDGTVLETRAAFLRQDEQVVLVHGLSLELGPAQHFFVAVEAKRRQVTVRLHPHPTPTRTPGVQAVVALVARELLALGGTIQATNLTGLEELGRDATGVGSEDS